MTDTYATETAETPLALPAGVIVHPPCRSWWTGLSRAHCTACCRTFSTDSAADKHRVGKFGTGRRCADPATVGLVPVTKSFGALWQYPGGDTRWNHDAA